jgi:hypothetical protein
VSGDITPNSRPTVSSDRSVSSANLVQFNLTGLLFGSSMLKGKPLADLVSHYATEEMLPAIAAEAAKGRLLLIATTDLDSERTVIWDMGAIALHGGPEGLKLFREVLIASASIPGLFPPVLIPVETSGTSLRKCTWTGAPQRRFSLLRKLRPYYPINWWACAVPTSTSWQTASTSHHHHDAGEDDRNRKKGESRRRSTLVLAVPFLRRWRSPREMTCT